MTQIFAYTVTLGCVTILLSLCRVVYNRIHYITQRNARGCGVIKKYRGYDPILGLDFVLAMKSALNEHRWLPWQKEIFAAQNSKTFEANFFGSRMIYSSESENVKAMSTSHWKEFGLQPIRYDNGVAQPFAGPDTSTEFLFGESLNSLTHPEKAEVAWAMVEVMRGIRVRLQMSKLLFLHHDKKWLDAVALVHRFIDNHIETTFEQLDERKVEQKDSKSSSEEERTDLLWDMAKQLPDKLALRSQILAVFVPSNDTTSIHIANIFFALARHPHAWAKCREEILALRSAPLTFEVLRGLKYVNWVLNETHRLYPNGIQMKGDIVHCNRYLMHRDPDTWGEDAEEFRPERWEEIRPLWRFVPFGGGPRICPAHILVATEAAYVLVRFVQRFKDIEARDEKPYTAVMRIGPSNLNGVKIGLVAN
ncbi:related to n-alkane-inducible cytochrome P450 [Phialocephala subalpina]|uniref:Related to n-alkane-inducible cytochrome P450 n=1 Tax=Phialocephala subalpina TaxID=576137 RepID=A0A1L7WIV0_9HELO|nr:related to n-alkane-inducible cytochrome P450 [Phialocephala subalpina]